MILELTKENLQKCGFDNEQIVKLLEWDNYAMTLFKDTCYYATNIDKKIYTENDGYRKYYFNDGNIAFPLSCPELISEYYDLALNRFLGTQKKLLKALYVLEDQTKKFILSEIKKTEQSIENIKATIERLPHFNAEFKFNAISIYEAYIDYLENKMNELNTLETNTETDIWYSEYELRQSIDIAIRWPVKTVYQNKNENNPYSVFAHDINNQRKNYELFCSQLKKRLTDNSNWKVIEIDLYDKFILMLDLYIEWYNTNKKETEIFGNYNPYNMIYSVVESTKKEILKFFPDIYKLNQPQQNEKIKPDEVNKELHYHIFKDNAFEFWQRLFENFNINETKRTDLRFMYEIMKYNGQIHETVTVKNITDWINDTYDFNIGKLQSTNIKDKSNESRMSIYNLIK